MKQVKKTIKLIVVIFAVLMLFVSCNSEIDGSGIGKTGQGLLRNISGIADFDELASIGVGQIEEASSSRAIGSNRHSGPKLVGIDKHGVYKTIVFLDEHNQEVEQKNYSLLNYLSFDRFTFFQFAPPEFFEWAGGQSQCGTFLDSATYQGPVADMTSLAYYWSAPNNYIARNPNMVAEFATYVLDNSTGKIYCLRDKDGTFLYPGFSPNSANGIAVGDYMVFTAISNTFSDYVYSDGNNGNLEYANSWTVNQNRENVYMTVEDGLLKLVTVGNAEKLNDWDSNTYFDRYGNCYSGNFKYMIDKTGTLKSLSGSCFLAMNGIVYFDGQWVTDNGELEPAAFIPASSYFCDDVSSKLIKTDGMTSYYHEDSSIKAVTFTDSNRIEYSVSTINLEDYDYTGTYQLANGRIYALTGSEIAYYTPEDGVKHILSNEYFYYEMECYKDGTIKFKGIDSKTNDVEGIINPNGVVDANTTISESGYTILYLTPIN